MSLLVAATLIPALVQVEQFGMAQCPMTSTLTTHFFNGCIKGGRGIAPIVNFTLNMVGGTSGGLINNSSDTKSFHGSQEITAEKYFLCARQLEPNLGIGSYQWLNFTNCMNGYAGIGICVLGYLPHEIEGTAKTCAEAHGINWAALDACQAGPQGDALFKASEYYTDGESSHAPGSN